jgi:hypothetical protein
MGGAGVEAASPNSCFSAGEPHTTVPAPLPAPIWGPSLEMLLANY